MLILKLKDYSKEQLQEMSLIEIAFELLSDRKEAIAFNDIMDELKNLLELSDEQVRAKIAQFYTDLNIDGRFLGLGDNRWGLRVWYPIDQVEEEVVTQIKPKKKKGKKLKDEDDVELDDYDELNEEDIDYDDIDEEDDLLDDDLLEDEEDLDDDELLEKDDDFDLDEEDEDEDDDLEEDDLEFDEDEDEDDDL